MGFADRRVPGFYFNEYNIKPTARIIAEVFNADKDFFLNVGFLSFIFAADKDELIREYQANLITRNMYLVSTGREVTENGDTYWDGTEAIFPKPTKAAEGINSKNISTKKILEEVIEKTFNETVEGLKKKDFLTNNTSGVIPDAEQTF